ncbi:aldehyde dehydrogenase [Gemella bergeri]
MSEVKVLKMFIGGKFEENIKREFIKVVNPATEEVIAKIPAGNCKDVDHAITVADVAQKSWEKLPAIERGAYLKKIADRIRQRETEITQTIVNEGGKTFELAKVEVLFTADYMDYMAEWARRYEGEIIQSDRKDEHIFLFKRPHGVTTGILPWNFPFFLIARKAAPALLTGNTIVLKPSQLTPINANIFAEICAEVGLPEGVLNIIYGRGSVVGNRLASHPKVGLVSLTGSLAAGQEVMKAAADNITNVSLELGGKAPAIVFEDADLELAAKAIVASRVINSGQVCNCAERVYVHENVKEQFEQILFAELDKVKFGDPNKERGLDYGPLIEKRALKKVIERVAYAVKQGATLAYGGDVDKEQVGYFYGPTVLTDVTNDMSIMKEETFGPVIPIATFKTLEEVIDYANDSEYGLTSSVYTKNLNTAFKAVNGLKFGETYINRENFEAMQGFHAGRRKSGIGGADGKHGLEEYLTTQVVYMQLGDE